MTTDPRPEQPTEQPTEHRPEDLPAARRADVPEPLPPDDEEDAVEDAVEDAADARGGRRAASTPSLRLARGAAAGAAAVARPRRASDEEIQAARERFAAILARTARTAAPHAAPAADAFPTPVAFTVTTLSAHAVYGGERTVAIFTDWAEAAEVVRDNAGDLWETTYHLAVIETVYLNELYGGFGDRPQWWFRWDGDDRTGGYVDIDPPEPFARTIGFGIG